ncbi:MAG: spore germination protein [Brevibacillus sp.]|nr:spore germination protein [Brevibacillus sp.]
MSEKTHQKKQISSNLAENKEFLNEKLGVGESFDIGAHELHVGSRRILLYYINGFADNEIVTMILRDLNNVGEGELDRPALEWLYHKYIPFFQMEKVDNLDDFMDKVLMGQVGLIIEDERQGMILDAKKYPGRNPEEPDLEKVVRGAHDGFTETLVMNTALTRRRVRDGRLRFEIMQVGERSKTDVAVAYLKDVANPKLVKTLKERIQEIKIDGIPMAEKTIEEFMIRQPLNPFPLVRYTERPDVAAIHLFEGHVLVYVDTSPSVMITPTTYFHHVQHAEEYRQTPVVGAYLRWVRFFGMIASIFLLPLWALLALNPSLIPEPLSYIGVKEKGSVPLIAQFILAELGVDLMRMAAIHTPTPLATAMGLIAAILIGEVAMKVGLFTPEVILYLAVAAIGTFATPSYELGLANRLVRIFLLLMVGIFAVPGFVLGIVAVLIGLAMTRSLNTPYLWPFIPFDFKALTDVMLRLAIPLKKTRPSIVKPQNPFRK